MFLSMKTSVGIWYEKIINYPGNQNNQKPSPDLIIDYNLGINLQKILFLVYYLFYWSTAVPELLASSMHVYIEKYDSEY